jgi:hypothetical protein
MKQEEKSEKIICAAIWIKDKSLKPVHTCTNISYGVVLCGYRHGHIVSQYGMLTGKRITLVEHVQGFLTTKNRFLDRVEAHKLFSNYAEPEWQDELYSEDLY